MYNNLSLLGRYTICNQYFFEIIKKNLKHTLTFFNLSESEKNSVKRKLTIPAKIVVQKSIKAQLFANIAAGVTTTDDLK